MKYLDREDLRNMVKEVSEADLLKDYSTRMTYKAKNGETRDMFRIIETQEEMDLLDKNIQEKIIINKEVEEKLKISYKTAKKFEDNETIYKIENKDVDYINSLKYDISREVSMYEKLDKHMQGIYSQFEETSKPWKEKDGEIYLVIGIEEREVEKYLYQPPIKVKDVEIFLATLNKELAVKECEKKQQAFKSREQRLQEQEGKSIRFVVRPQYKVIKYSDLVHEYNNVLAKNL